MSEEMASHISSLSPARIQAILSPVKAVIFDVDGIWYAITVAEVFAVLLSVGFLLAKRKKYHYM